ncbi:hypothetical protein AX16_005399 [Volvariella volvacea WC 439]|nr:hypothetical protein AX16_005399 [Volvariella volvacea WC 439]
MSSTLPTPDAPILHGDLDKDGDEGNNDAPAVSSEEESSSESESGSSETTDSESDGSDEEITQEYLDSLLEKAKANARAAAQQSTSNVGFTEEDIITLDSEEKETLPPLNPGNLPEPYMKLGKTRFDGLEAMRDPDVEQAEKDAASQSDPAPPVPPPELTTDGKQLTKRQKKELKNKTAGPNWFDLPAPSEADLPRLYREVEALRLRNQLDPKRFYRKDEGEGKGIKGLPKHFAIGTIVSTTGPFGTRTSDNLSRAERKRTLVDELIDDAEAKRYAKKKFSELQASRTAKGRNTLAAKKALRAPKW